MTSVINFSENLDVDIRTRFTHQYFGKREIIFESDSVLIGDSKLIISPLFEIYLRKEYSIIDKAFIREIEIDESSDSKVNIDVYLLTGNIKEINNFKIHIAYIVFDKDQIILELIPAI